MNKEGYLLEKQQKEKTLLLERRKRKIKKMFLIFLPVILIAGGIILAVVNYSPEETPNDKFSFKQAIGKQAPDFSLEGIDGKTIKLSDYKGKNVVLFFNEGSMCYPACWDQMAALGNDERFNAENLAAFSIVVDPKSEWEKIVKETPGFDSAEILFDTTKAVSRAYDVLSLRSSMHPGSFPGHTFFIINKEGIIRYVLDDPSMAIRNDMLISELSKLGEE
ncbi:MAG: Alkyl hydroperoxide reductase/ Thiol specific antioxidant/ Mal allergen [Parcubacteria group bacterium GW2011_GWF2_43_11]|nr:MAG: Alkyl hydroperoxide reductase/ Thiol specific antioxidant/ Mal allergen [Parcubacteria group bacterium GW2011_GWF2_43_11]